MATKIAIWVTGLMAAVCAGSVAVGWWLIGGLSLDSGFSDVELSWRSQLPEGATEVQEWSWADGFLPDYSYVLKAKVSEDEFFEFNRRLGILLKASDRSSLGKENWLSWDAPPFCDEDWWNPTEKLDATYVRESADTWTYSKYEKGYLFFKSLNH
ncbi:MAG: hypothetical protein AAGD22_08900 [Verrucomicrobiota bacterium]